MKRLLTFSILVFMLAISTLNQSCTKTTARTTDTIPTHVKSWHDVNLGLPVTSIAVRENDSTIFANAAIGNGMMYSSIPSWSFSVSPLNAVSQIARTSNDNIFALATPSRPLDDTLRLYKFNAGAWQRPTGSELINTTYTIPDSGNLVGYGTDVYVVLRKRSDGLFYVGRYNGSGWAVGAAIPTTSTHTPRLFVNANGQYVVDETKLYKNTGGSWSTLTTFQSLTKMYVFGNSTQVAVIYRNNVGNKSYCVVYGESDTPYTPYIISEQGSDYNENEIAQTDFSAAMNSSGVVYLFHNEQQTQTPTIWYVKLSKWVSGVKNTTSSDVDVLLFSAGTGGDYQGGKIYIDSDDNIYVGGAFKHSTCSGCFSTFKVYR